MEADHATGPASPTEYVTTEPVPTEPVPMPATEPSTLSVFVSAEPTLMNEPAMVPGPMESVPSTESALTIMGLIPDTEPNPSSELDVTAPILATGPASWILNPSTISPIFIQCLNQCLPMFPL